MAPATAVPPALPPSVEEAYRRKCIQLKQRTSEVEEANDAARLRLARLKRQVEKMRLERAFLLEQLAKRTSTNVEDSDGSPSPPPTPKEKPLRIKRGHRKPSAFSGLDAPSSVNAGTPGSTFISQNLLVHSPSSDAFSAAAAGSKTNGVHRGAPKKPGSAFDLYCAEAGPSVKDKAKEGDSVEEELSRRWKDLSESRRDEYQTRADDQMAEYDQEKDAYDEAKAQEREASAKAGSNKAESTESDRPPAGGAGEGRSTSGQQDDVDMTNYDTDQETQGERVEE
ncbi:hypothetical protein N658DRAFT_502746 [Parathielavia hyrcaniae]|uniref:HMG box domain-containing protein n=1 Tax=Parathielavia hyrcaniae TaxID=113614 RepID=A0AAN6QDI0_9PEZI|nr:hypothetical protein N658DRAFT_502746 [Parathielavia hyrcaniae]